MSDLLGGLGGLMKGLSGFMPQDDPNVKLMNAQGELGELKKKELDAYAQIGKKAVETYGLQSFGPLADNLRLIQSNISNAEQQLSAAKTDAEREKNAQKAAEEQTHCLQCDAYNEPGAKFCASCGAALDQKLCCTGCGKELSPGTKFCAGCGQKVV